MGDYGQANLTTYRLPKPYAFPVYNAAQSQQCTIYVPPYWSPAGLVGPPLTSATAPKKEGDPWP